jgi:hypothetical protein
MTAKGFLIVAPRLQVKQRPATQRSRSLKSKEVVGCGALMVACIGLGAEVTGLGPSIPVWTFGMIACLLFGVVIWRVVGFAHPLAWMSILYSAYFLLGSQNWTEPSRYLGFRNYVSTEPTLRLAFFGLASLGLGVLAIAGTRRYAPIQRAGVLARSDDSAGLARTAGRLLAVVGVVGLVMSVRGGLPILHPAIRSEANHGLWAYCAYALVPAALLLTLNPSSARRDAAVLGVSSVLLIVMAYRSPVILLVGTFLILRQVQGRIRPRTVILGALGLLAFAVIVFSYRAAAVVRGGYVIPSGLLREFPVLYPIYSGFAREGVAVLSRVHELMPSSTPFMHGGLQLSMFHLHGGTASPRQHVYDVVYGTNVARTTYTPTLLGGPYMDFGFVGVVSEMFVVGLVLGRLYRWMTESAGTWRLLCYSYAAVLSAMSIHTGLLDDETLLIVPAMMLTSMFVARNVGIAARLTGVASDAPGARTRA